MTIGISKERLIEINDLTPTGTEYLMGKKAMLEELISHECKELNPWLPIDENTPKDREILGLIDGNYKSIIHFGSFAKNWINDCGDIEIPTHWQELPENPKGE